MHRIFTYFITGIVLLGMAVSCKGAKVIPEDDLVDIYVEMYMLDQWLSRGRTPRELLDSSFVYGGILEKYGYTADDMRLTIEKNLENPEEFIALFEQVRDFLQAKVDELSEVNILMLKQDSILNEKKKLLEKVKMPPLYKDVLVGLYPRDTVCPGPDSLGYTFVVPELDTMYVGPAMIIKNKNLDSTSLANQKIVKNLVQYVPSLKKTNMIELK